MIERPDPLPVPACPVNADGTADGTAAEARGPISPDAGLPADVAWLFRRSLAAGRIHPLMPLLLRYRREHTT